MAAHARKVRDARVASRHESLRPARLRQPHLGPAGRVNTSGFTSPIRLRRAIAAAVQERGREVGAACTGANRASTCAQTAGSSCLRCKPRLLRCKPRLQAQRRSRRRTREARRFASVRRRAAPRSLLRCRCAAAATACRVRA
jgi:hypothetical protein